MSSAHVSTVPSFGFVGMLGIIDDLARGDAVGGHVDLLAARNVAADLGDTRLQPGHALLFIEDGVLGATTGSATEAQVRQACATFKVYALLPDLDARGLAQRLIEGVTGVDYGGFVDLTLAHSTSHSWL